MQFVGVAGRDDVSEMVDFVTNNGVGDFEHIADENGVIWQEFGVRSQPAFVFISADGSSETLSGGLGYDGLVERIEALS